MYPSPVKEAVGPRGRVAAVEICSRLKQAGHEAYLVGGGVRDLLLGLDPSDFDVATSATPQEVEQLFCRTVPVGKAFGVMVVLHRGAEIEVATFRKDLHYEDGRHPQGVSFCDAREDALRRDLTINALFMQPETGEILDFTGGVDDLCHGRIRTVGDPVARFEEDRLRTLRAVRFAARLGFAMDPDTREAIRQFAHRLEGVSAERILAELHRMLTSSGAGRGVRELCTLGLMEGILPQVAASLQGRDPWDPEGKDRLEVVVAALNGPPAPSAPVGFAVLLSFLGVDAASGEPGWDKCLSAATPLAGQLMADLSSSRDLRRGVEQCLELAAGVCAPDPGSKAQQKRLVLRPGFSQALDGVRRMALARGGEHLPRFLYYLNLFREVQQHPAEFYRLVSGADLIRLGFPPGPQFKVLLAAVEDRVLEGAISTREEALDWLRRQVRHGDLPMGDDGSLRWD